uniref:Protein N-lysine methyltransferase METTL21A n=1 Tax=Rhizophora mucronata TaxID=61149 RepID=A0A2P2KWC1_RHIMU
MVSLILTNWSMICILIYLSSPKDFLGGLVFSVLIATTSSMFNMGSVICSYFTFIDCAPRCNITQFMRQAVSLCCVLT